MLIDFDFLAKKYQIKLGDVLHLGANTGQEAETYDRLGAQRVVWVEALGTPYRQLKENIKRFPSHIALQACVSDVTGQVVVFNVTNNQAQSSSFLEFGTHATEHPTVKVVSKVNMVTITVEDLLKINDISINRGAFLNADLQGAEFLALKGMEDLMHLFDHVYIEVNEQELYKGCALVGEIDDFLLYHRFTGMETKMTGSGWGDKYYRRIP